jgi:D-glycero-alpha-D-manno-heptose 1-phosphate guanylyltransferase
VKAIILAGGLGTRLRSVINEVPKPLAPVNGVPYLAYIINALYIKGLRDIILSVGYKAEQFDAFVAAQRRLLPELNLSLVVEPRRLGTGGAVRYCYQAYPDSRYLIFNGDSFCDFNLADIVEAAETKGAAMVVAKSPNISRYGEVSLFDDGRVEAFHEKKNIAKPGWINAGIYCVPAEAILPFDSGASFSFELEIIPKLMQSGLYAIKAMGAFIDIGIPEDYREFTNNPSAYFPQLPRLG